MTSGATRNLMLAVASLLVLGSTQAFAVTGETIAVVQRAVIQTDGTRITLNVGQPVSVGDIIATGDAGQAELIFPDQTRIVVGPNSQLEITNLLFRNNGTARKFSVTAVRGTFRFLSGNSPSRSYNLRTPTATMGVRGTAFDFAVAGRDETDLVVYNGEVQMCARGARCARVPGGCQAVKLDRRGVFTQPQDTQERAQKLAARFPYAINDDRLTRPFRLSSRICGEDSRSAAPLPVRQIRLPDPPRSTSFGGGTAPEPPRSGNPAE